MPKADYFYFIAWSSYSDLGRMSLPAPAPHLGHLTHLTTSLSSFREKIYLILKATRQHARNLAFFAVIYKSSMLLLRALNPLRPGKEGPYDTFLAGLLGGYTVFGRGKQGSVNQQVLNLLRSPTFKTCKGSDTLFFPFEIDRDLHLRARHARPRQTLNSTPPHPLLHLLLTHLLIDTPLPLPRHTRKDPNKRLARLRQSELGNSHVYLPMVS